MSAAARTPVKAPAKPGPQRPNAWTGSRASPTFSAAAASRPGFPALANGSDKDKIVSALSGVTGTAVTITTKPNTVYHGTVVAASSTTITLADVTQPNNPTAPVTPSLSLNPSDVLNWAPAQSPKDTFHTDTDISAKKGKGAERELQAWQPDQPANDGDAYDMSNTNGKQWDQFAANETMFGVTTSWDENQYTTPLDRSAPDFKEKERKAQMQANEIMNQQSSNPHIQEERIQNLTGDSGDKEEEKYSGVTRGAGAYVPPGARKPGSAAPTPPPAKPTGAAANNSDSNIPTVAVTKDDKDPKTPSDPTKAFKIFVDSEKERLKAKKTDLFKKDMNSKVADLLKFSQSFKLNKPIPDDLVPILAKDADKQRQIKEKSLNDAGSSQARAIGVSSPTASGSTKASAAGANAARPTSRISPELKAAMKNMVIPERKPKPGETSTKPSAPVVAVVAAAPIPTPPVKATQSTGPPKAKVSASGKPLIPMHIPAIPAFKGKGQTPEKKETTPNGAANAANAKPALNINANSFKPNVAAKPFTPGGASPKPGNSPKPAHKEPAGPPNPFFGSRQLKKSTSHIKEDFNPFKHSRVADGATVSSIWPYHGKRYMMMFPPAPQQPQQPPPPNAAQHPHPMPVPIPMPPFTHPQHFPPHMVPPHMPQNGQQPNAQQGQQQPGQPAQPPANGVNGAGPSGPPPYSEEDAAQAAQRAAAAGYVYPTMFGAPMPGAPPPQPGQPGQPGQPAQVMPQMYPYYPGMPPPPPGMAYMPPFMAAPHMAGYPGMPAGMPAMYAPPGMGMPPHPQAGYPMPPPPGTGYPGPQPGQQQPQQPQPGQQQQNGGRPSMPPTPIPAHAHPAYWNQSPQMGHAVPFMMMPPPPPQGVPPQHGQYDPNAQQQMGGHA